MRGPRITTCDFCMHHKRYNPYCDECKKYDRFERKAVLHPILQKEWEKQKSKMGKHGLKPGYNRSICLEPLILDREEYSNSTWNIFCQLFGISGRVATTIKVNIDSVESWIEEE